MFLLPGILFLLGVFLSVAVTVEPVEKSWEEYQREFEGQAPGFDFLLGRIKARLGGCGLILLTALVWLLLLVSLVFF